MGNGANKNSSGESNKRRVDEKVKNMIRIVGLKISTVSTRQCKSGLEENVIPFVRR